MGTNLAVIQQMPHKVLPYINSFLQGLEIESENTKKAYETAIRDFFLTTKNKDIEDLLVSDLRYNLMDFERYQTFLLNKYKRATVNLKITAIKQLFDKFVAYDLDINTNFLKVKSVKQHDTEHYGSLSILEVNNIINFLSTQKKGYEKQCLVKLAFATAFRKDSLLNLTWNDFQIENDHVLVSCIGKGNKLDIKKISTELFEELLELKSSDKVFTLSPSGVQRMMNTINDNLSFKDRNITFHSFKKASIEEVARQTNNDLKIMQRHGNHSSVTTTLNAYLRNKDVDDLVIVDNKLENTENNYIFHLTNRQIYDIINSMSEDEQSKFKKICYEKGYLNEQNKSDSNAHQSHLPKN